MNTPSLTCRMLAQRTGRNLQTIKNLAPQIPGGTKHTSMGYWLFPETSVAWVKARRAGNPHRNIKKK